MPWPYLNVGDEVVVEEGALAGLQGILVRVKDSVRVVISLTLLQRSVAVELDRDCVRPFGAGSAVAGRPIVEFRRDVGAGLIQDRSSVMPSVPHLPRRGGAPRAETMRTRGTSS